jgi:pimeloyl-ACP methyl ester carboxylesterase
VFPEDQALKEKLRATFPGLGLQPIDRLRATSVAKITRRTGTTRPPTEDIELLSLTRGADGVLRWEVGMPTIQAMTGGRRAGARSPQGTIVEQFAFKKLPPNQVGSILEALDLRLTLPRGLRRWNPANQQLEPFQGAGAANKNVLLFVHGTFSNCDSTFEELNAAPNNVGKDLLNDAANHYDMVLTFDHPTVAVSPAMNAFDLATALRPLPKALDIVAHSRGGLVARWFLEGFADTTVKKRAVLVAASIAGTSLAAPHRLKAAFNHLANVGSFLAKASSLAPPHPFIVASGTLLSVVSSIIKFGTSTPVLDAAVAMIPGLQGQSRVGNNPELVRLRDNYSSGDVEYSAVRADFQPKDPGWNFLQYFSKPLQRLENWGADLVFDCPNDMVVDVDSMNDFADNQILPASHIHDFGVSEIVHHTNYFRQPETLAFIRKQLAF